MKLFLQNFSKFFPYRIWQQIFVVFVLFTIVSLFILGSLLIKTSQDAIRTTVFRDHKEIVTRAAGEVKEFLKGPRESLFVTASMLGTLQADPWRAETVLVGLALRYPLFHRVASIDLQGQEQAHSDLGMPLLDRSGDVAFQKAMSGEFYQSEVSISDDHLPVMTWAVPIRQLGQVRGVLLAEVNLRGVWDIVDSIKIGTSGWACLFDNQGHVLSHPDKKFILMKINVLPQRIIDKIVAGKTGSEKTVDESGEDWITFYSQVPEIGWGLIIFQSPDEVFAFLKKMKQDSRLLIIFSTAAVVILTVILSKLISRPINRLIVGTQQISRGNFDEPLQVQRNDEMGQLMTAFNDMMEKLKTVRRMEKLSTIGQAATAIAHELKNSLILVNTYVELLPERYQDEEFVQELSRVVPEELNSWKAMLQEMMDYSSLDRLILVPLDVNSLLQGMENSIKEMARLKNIRLQFQFTKELPMINGDAERLKRVVLNVIANAFDSTSAGGAVMVATRFEPRENNNRVCVDIKDTGKGINPQIREKIFEPFYTTKSNGLGLGLTICREIIERHGGEIGLLSQNSQGALFRIDFPALSANYSRAMIEQTRTSTERKPPYVTR